MKEQDEGCITTIIMIGLLCIGLGVVTHFTRADTRKENAMRNMELKEEIRGLGGKTITEVREYDWSEIGGNQYLEFSFTDGTKLVLTSEEGIWIDRGSLPNYKTLIKEL